MTVNPNAAAMRSRNSAWLLGLLLGLPERRATEKRKPAIPARALT